MIDRRAFLALSAAFAAGSARAEVSVGRVVHYERITSKNVDPRKVSVWLPPGYDTGEMRYDVIYMHDGQNLFDPSTAPFGEWGVDEVLSGMIQRGEVPPTIVVGVWNTQKRLGEYLPNDLLDATLEPTRSALVKDAGFPPQGDGYVTFLADELKPFIDRTYRTRPERAATTVMGSSMGGLISFYAGLKRSDVFGQAGCVSTHWPLGIGHSVPDDVRQADILQALDAWLPKALPAASAKSCRFYFDGGSVGLDAAYGPYQAKVDAIFAAKGYVQGRDTLTRRFPGADHNEPAWRARLPIPLKFLLAPGAGQV